MHNNPLYLKLCELDEELLNLKNSLECTEDLKESQLNEVIKSKQEEYEKFAEKLDLYINSGRSLAVRSMAEIQKEYFSSFYNLLKYKIPQYMHSDFTNASQDNIETMMLSAEYAIDFAKQAVTVALITSLAAIKAEKEYTSLKENKNERS